MHRHLKSLFRSTLVGALLMSPVSVFAADLVIATMSGPASMDPHYTATAANAEATKHVFDTLLRSGNSLEILPSLATSWEALDDTTWEFKLREGVKFHDGSDFTAEDVKFSIERIPDVTGPNPSTIYIRRVADVEIIDDYTIRVMTNGPAPTLPNDFVRLFIVSHTAAADYSTQETSAEGFNTGKATIGTGPYKFVSWAPTQDLILEKFDGYWEGAQPWDKVTRKEIPNHAARVAQLLAGQVDIISKVPATDLASIESAPNLEIVKTESVYIPYLEFDFREDSPQVWDNAGNKLAENPFRDPRVREAFDLALDRESIVEFALEDMGIVATQLVSTSIFGYNDQIAPPVYDVNRALELMEEAGYPEGFRVALSYSNDRMPTELGPTVAQMLASINVTTDVQGVPAAVFNPAKARGEYSLYMASWGTLTGEANYMLSSLMHTNDPETSLGAFNTRGYSNPTMDKLIEDAAVEMDEDTRRSLLEEANMLVATDRPGLPLATNLSAWGIRADKLTYDPRSDEDTLAMDIHPIQ
ncbi:MAG TPA: ABC transporter substrate-binding protein [Pelagibacterium sp.]|uniref:ABC transporter substrate-binding protein n=1 Tax=Pelagibacterium sp. TaxID=1967288 RepID=UPI002D1CA0F0|nr:ABC transporter substrate-binding protein [Pelagibacterium sp.]HWJ88404.1 ABC transporter substrate-binding protein [Pelagibacterium sp.]